MALEFRRVGSRSLSVGIAIFLAVIGKYRDAHRYRDGSDSPALVLDLEILHLPAELFGSLPDRSLLGRSHDQNELFAAIAGDDILAPRSGQHVLAYCTQQDRKSTRLNSSHITISYAAFCLKKNSRPACDRADHPPATARGLPDRPVSARARPDRPGAAALGADSHDRLADLRRRPPPASSVL